MTGAPSRRAALAGAAMATLAPWLPAMATPTASGDADPVVALFRCLQTTQARCDAVEAQHDAVRAELIDCYGALIVASDDARRARLDTLAEEINMLTDAAGALSVRIDATAPTSAEGAAIKLRL
ncbi:hypothetical protein, partial [Acidisphaera rubrifaciens]